ncbi:hypothetical protein Nepgr_001042 [Nepenthes gracilis]|uniref:Uncharacterized protein n=1 Tax=Nepenthes gracilis TaxID=150966 RepID=A0AAD3P4H8_NEPGR|nr:hypothetical protein Nepgr_001042 [Nepenthes gracilis]
MCFLPTFGGSSGCEAYCPRCAIADFLLIYFCFGLIGLPVDRLNKKKGEDDFWPVNLLSSIRCSAGQLIDRFHGLRNALSSTRKGCPVGLTWSFWGSSTFWSLLSCLDGLGSCALHIGC